MHLVVACEGLMFSFFTKIELLRFLEWLVTPQTGKMVKRTGFFKMRPLIFLKLWRWGRILKKLKPMIARIESLRHVEIPTAKSIYFGGKRTARCDRFGAVPRRWRQVGVPKSS